MGVTAVWVFLTNSLLFAVEEAEPAGPLGDWTNMLCPMVAIMFLFYFLIMRPQKQEQARRAMLSSVKKNERVLTASGIYGVVTNVDVEANEVTIKVDEATNTKLRMTLSSVVTRVREDEASGDGAKKA